MGRGELDIISLRGLSAVGKHGVYEFERNGSQVFSADITLYLDATEAAETDDVRHTVDYSRIADRAAEVLTGPPVYLLETLANRLAEMALEDPLVQEVEVTVHKPMAPVAHLFNDVSVTLRRKQTQTTAAEPARPASNAALSSVPPQLANLAAGTPPPAPTAPTPKLRVSRVVLALGANLGQPRKNLIEAVEALIEAPGLELDDVSPLVISAPVLAPGQAPQPDYYNAVVVARTVLTPPELLQLTQSIENQFGRVRDEKWGPRTLDIDIIDFAGKVSAEPNLTLPHPRAARRAFVLRPWALIAPEDELPGHGSVEALAQRAPDLDGIKEVDPDWLNEPAEAESARKAKPALPVDEPDPTEATEPGAPEREVVIRGNKVRLTSGDGDPLFQRILEKELAPPPPPPTPQVVAEVAPADPVPFPSRRSIHAADQPPATPVVPEVLPTEEIAETAAPAWTPAPISYPQEDPSPPAAVPLVPAAAPPEVFLEAEVSLEVDEPELAPQDPPAAEDAFPEAPKAGLDLPDWRSVVGPSEVRIVDTVELSPFDDADSLQGVPEEVESNVDLAVPPHPAQHRRVVRPTPTGMFALGVPRTSGAGAERGERSE